MTSDADTPTGQAGPVESGRPTAEIAFTLFGTFSVTHGGAEIKLRNRKGQALLAYLLLSPTHKESRERLVGLLWSESGEERARASLRQTLKELRDTLAARGVFALETDRSDVQLSPAGIGSDFQDVVGGLDRGRIDPILLERTDVANSLLAGFDDIDPSFRSWLLVLRQSLHDRMVRSLELPLEKATAAQQPNGGAAQALLNLDASHEVACRALMLHAAEQGDIGRALKHYKTLWDLLDAEYDMEPSAETQQLAVRIKSGEIAIRKAEPAAAPASAVARGPAPGLAEETAAIGPAAARRYRPRLLLDPFTAANVHPDRAHLVGGFRHDLLTRLARFREWYVFDGGQGGLSASSMAATDNLYRLSASFYESNDELNLMLTVQLVATGEYVWSDRQVVVLERWHALQSRLVRQIAIALNIHLTAERIARLSSLPEVPAPLFDRWLYGQHLGGKWQPDEEARAADIFRSIIASDPDFAPAYSSLVQSENARHLIYPGLMRDAERARQALDLAKRATQLDPLDTRAQLCLAWSHALNGNFELASIAFTVAYELNEAEPWTLVSSAQGLAFCGRLDEAKRIADMTIDLGLTASPLHWGYQVGTRFLLGEYELCVRAADQAQNYILNLAGWKTAALALLGRMDEARHEAASFVALIRSNWFGAANPSERDITAWFLHCFPIRDQNAHGALQAGLQRAELDVG
ncbi:MAG TPA: BTAD domain-containing putative transcriptional regulator [Dongiaceae bacterium]|nr:BTAD domain-containing putative transcriptional regulator [Dongiaceae bacterium]